MATPTTGPRQWHRFSVSERIMRSAFYLMALIAIVWSIRSIEIIPELARRAFGVLNELGYLNVEIRVGEQVMHLLHDYPDYEIDFRVFRCGLISRESDIQHLRVHDHRWVTLSEMNQYQFPAADARTLEKLLDLDH